MPLTVLAIADQVSDVLYDYFRPERWEGVDFILSCGDLPPSYLDFLCSSLNVPVFYVRGNHDGQYAPSLYNGCDNLHGRIVEYRGVRIAGFQGCRQYNDGDLQYTERQMRGMVWRARLRAWLSGPPDIVLTHAPPAAVHACEDHAHRGFECFDRAIEVWRPSFFVHGHVHAYQREELVSHVGDTTVINAYPYHVFEVRTAEERAPAPAQKTQTPAVPPTVSSPLAQPRKHGLKP